MPGRAARALIRTARQRVAEVNEERRTLSAMGRTTARERMDETPLAVPRLLTLAISSHALYLHQGLRGLAACFEGACKKQ